MVNHVDVIAEVGSNHGGDLHTAVRYIEAVSAIKADAVKFQGLQPHLLMSPERLARIAGPESITLPEEWLPTLRDAARLLSIELLCTPLYLGAVEALERIGVKRYKIASGDLTFTPLLEAVGHTGKPVLLSTGASTIEEVEVALNTLVRAGAGLVTLMHCVSAYPAQMHEMNLRALWTLQGEFGVPAGLSDHTIGSITALIAIGMGATIIEKHITFCRLLNGPDHSFALEVNEFDLLVEQIRIAEAAMGTGVKAPAPSENPASIRRTPDAEGVWLRQ